ncbi:hypothetical protein SE15_01620 [Thermanaerothrix daxensis]|uniref:NrtR DNA-binding winged helix domain-containing protein n=1 Tax=Thermanaerothrix daxensis TaxID=869279 RepID=A0A0P6XM96_9CHLR|nr:NUDIX hydrolase [Thermanaerothrix daxensis]KPL83936.1 hypothetical protein SE15_01620 [Thermanaerothrix daxensis]
MSHTINLEVLLVIFTLKDEALQVWLQPCHEAHAEGQWALPAKPFEGGCSLEQTAYQCLETCLGLREAYLEQLYTYGEPDRHPHDCLISVAYFALIAMDAIARLAPTTPTGAWFPLTRLPPLILDHASILAYALRRLRYKLEYTAVGFELLPELFTLSEIQHTYELILGERLDKRNFRRRLLQAGVIEPTPHVRSGEGRPARLYRYRPDAIAEIKARRLFP